jgi:hypothetical protein
MFVLERFHPRILPPFGSGGFAACQPTSHFSADAIPGEPGFTGLNDIFGSFRYRFLKEQGLCQTAFIYLSI